ncbi:MAG: hypothetical protein B7X65_19665 [Polaromonas sp. 39-63-25]|nr:MAG: hypothetical protein B7X65_19665 [Polaromonas sp. 39-63-25]
MMLALPLQGFAAASMLYCGMGPDHGEQVSVAASYHHMDGLGEVQHEHSSMGKTEPLAKQSPDGQKQLPNTFHKCGVCASCCSVLAISDFPRTVKVQSSPHADLAELSVLIHAVPPGLPEKPPHV